ncbi:hypothetical protein Tco_1522730 [Tanacetum coccineum]
MTTLKFVDTHNMVKTINGEAQLHALVDGKKIIVTESSVRRDLQLADEEGVDCLPNSTIFEQLTLLGKPKRKDIQIPHPSDPIENVVDEAVHKELGDSLVRAVTTASSLEAEQDNGNINKTQSKETPNKSSSLGTTSGGGPRCQETIRDTIAQTRFDSVSKHSNDSLLARGNTLQSDEDRLKLDELMAMTYSPSPYKTGAAGNVVSTAGDATTVSAATTTTATITTVDDITLAQALMEIKSTKPKEKRVFIQELGESTTHISQTFITQSPRQR